MIDFEILMPFSMMVILGGIIGSRFGAVNAHEKTIRRLLVVVLILAATKRGIELLF